jgi:photosystem II PsbM protein
LCTLHILTHAFVPSAVANVVKAGVAALPVAAISAPAFALGSIVESLPSETVALQVQGGAYLAVLLGTILPVLFLINLFIQTESRKAGKAGGQDSE